MSPLEKLDMWFWIGAVIFGLITYAIRRSRLNKWNSARDRRVTGIVAFRPQSAYYENQFLSGVEWAFTLITVALVVAAMFFIPN